MVKLLAYLEGMELNQREASRSGRTDDARRARLLLLLEAGHIWVAIRDKLDCNDAFIDRCNKRFREERLAGLFSRHAGQEAISTSPRPIPPGSTRLNSGSPRSNATSLRAACSTSSTKSFLYPSCIRQDGVKNNI